MVLLLLFLKKKKNQECVVAPLRTGCEPIPRFGPVMDRFLHILQERNVSFSFFPEDWFRHRGWTGLLLDDIDDCTAVALILNKLLKADLFFFPQKSIHLISPGFSPLYCLLYTPEHVQHNT